MAEPNEPPVVRRMGQLRPRLHLLVTGLIGAMVCGICAAVVDILLELFLLPRLPPHRYPYGSASAFSVYACAVLGFIAATALKSSGSGQRAISFVVTLVFAAIFVPPMRLIGSAEWDSGYYLVYPLPTALAAIDLLLIAFAQFSSARSAHQGT